LGMKNSRWGLFIIMIQVQGELLAKGLAHGHG
jgi:hypothetical protein